MSEGITADQLEVPPITNSAPANTLPVTIDGDGNLGDSSITWENTAGNLELSFNASENGTVQLEATGLGTQIALTAADGDATHVGGEVSIHAGDSDGQSGGQLNITAGVDTADGDGGSVVISSGSSQGVGGGGGGGDIDIRVGAGLASDGDGGDLQLAAGIATDGDGGNIVLQAGDSTNGTPGTVQAYSPNGNSSIDLSNGGLTVTGEVGFYGGAPAAQPVIPASPNAQDIADVLVALGLATQTP